MDGQEQKIRRLDALVIEESSGVDHPANLADGWIVVKEEGRMPAAEKAFTGPHAYKPSAEDPAKCAVCGKKDADGMHKGLGATKKEEGRMPDAINKEGLSADQLAAVEALEATLAKAETDKATAEAALAKATATPPPPVEKAEPDLASISKAVEESEKLRKAAEAALTAEVEKAAKLEERVTKMERERQEGEYIAKAKDLGNLASNANALGLLLLDINEKVETETFKQLEQLLKAANAQLESSGMFKAIGHPLGEEDSLEARIQKKAEAMVAAGSASTVQIAKAKVLETDSDIRAEYIARRQREGR